MDKIVDTLHRRTVLSVIYTIVLQTVMIFLFAFLNVDIFHPVSWLSSVFSKAASFSLWAYYIVLCALLAALSGVLKSRILNGPYLFTSRFDRLRDFLRLGTLFVACLHVLIGLIISCLYLAVIDGKYSDLRKQCNYSSGFCVSEGKVFLLYSGAWSGMYVFLRNFFRSFIAQFPVIQQLTFLRLKAELLPTLKLAMKDALLPCLLYPLLYFVNGNTIVHIVSDVFDLSVEEKLFSSFVDFFNITLLLYTWTQTVILIFSVKMMEHIFNILLTDLPEFPIACRFGETSVGTLHEVIAAQKYPVIQNWGCFDLFHLAKNDYGRRQEIFALSQPGGHPNNWNAIKKECLYVIDTFVESVNIAVSEITSFLAENTESSSTTTAAAAAAAPPPRITREMSPALRNLCIPSQEAVSFRYEQLNEEPLVVWHKVFENVVSFIKSLFPPLLKKTGLNQIFDKFPDARLKLVFSHCLPVINAVQGLAFLVSASLREDEYGVVQKDLNAIIISILQLKLTVDRAIKLGNFKRSHKNDHRDVQMKATLKSALKRSLYKICVTYRDHIQELDLPSSVANNLNPYLTLRE